MTLGFDIAARGQAVTASIVQNYKALEVANVSDCMSRMFSAGANLRPYHRIEGTMAGPALTVRTRPGDNLLIHRALEMAQPGDVIVVDASGDLTNALIGELMVTFAIKNGLAGIVLNGAIRDSAFIGSHAFPVFAAGVTHRGPYKDGPGEVNTCISIGGMVVTPGDLVIGDADGVLAVPIGEVEAVLARVQQLQQAEAKMKADIAAGCYDPSWASQKLKVLGARDLTRA